MTTDAGRQERAGTLAAVWGAVNESALRRLGKPLLLAYLVLLVVGIVVVGASLLWMRSGPMSR